MSQRNDQIGCGTLYHVKSESKVVHLYSAFAIYMDMLKGALPPADQKHVYTKRSKDVGTHFTDPEWKAEWTIAGTKVTEIFNPRPGRGLNRGPQDWEAEIFTTARTPQSAQLNNNRVRMK